MDVDASDVVAVADRIGIVAFAFSGVELGLRRRLDLFGLLVMGVVCATGGGLVRDVIVGRTPYVLDRADYLLLAAGAALISIPLALRLEGRLRLVLALADAAGLGAFAVAGAFVGIRAGLPLPAILVLAMVTATGGGVLRDVLAARVPLVLRSEVNATAAAAGGLVVWAVEPLSAGTAALLGAFVAAAARVLSLAWHLNLPVPRRRRG